MKREGIGREARRRKDGLKSKMIVVSSVIVEKVFESFRIVLLGMEN